MLSNNTKFNLLLGDNFNKLVSLPTKQVIMRSILSVIDRDFIVSSNNSSLAELVQKLLDKVLNEKQEIVDIISDLFSMENKSDLSFYKEIFDSDMFSSIITTNFDYTLEENFLNLIKINTPFDMNNDESGKIAFYKIYGDYKDKDIDKFVLSSQDIKRIKVLGFYAKFWEKLRIEFNKRATIILGANLEDKEFLDILDFIMSKTDRLQTTYLYINDEIDKYMADKNITNFINKYSIEIIKGEAKDFIPNLKERFFDEKKSGDALQNFAWLVRTKQVLTKLKSLNWLKILNLLKSLK